ncbi:hypothetical protein HPB48_026112 [Haemaphysalis longicornis]|uniref:Uncharacterized protein n=1 Tax=Haemaphysalis longicornis TaxID=44386 RepID=A0A9J6HBL5_HAELO|nr:hypothetical protein HPB48_026112 [Haemaphysalis longicornis]
MLSDRRRAKQVYQQTAQAPGIKTASRIPEGSFNQQIVIQVQAVQNLIVVSTPNDEYAEILCEVTSLQLGAATYNILPYIKPFPGIVRGVIHGLDVGTTTEQLPYIIASSGPRIVQARMLGKSTSAVVTYEDLMCLFTFVRMDVTPTADRTADLSSAAGCGDIGHRLDVCPTPEVSLCAQCHAQNTHAPRYANCADSTILRQAGSALRNSTRRRHPCTYGNGSLGHCQCTNGIPNISRQHFTGRLSSKCKPPLRDNIAHRIK